MKTLYVALLAASISACAYVPAQPTEKLTSPFYASSGEADGVRAYVYGKHTVLEFDPTPFFIVVKDERDGTIPWEKVGQYYRLDKQYNTFTVWINGKATTFSKR